MSALKCVKRYANRKLYDKERSCYVTLDDIATMIKAGDEVQIVDNKSGEDLTSVTLAQIIFETEKKNNFMPLSLLRGLIQDSGEAIGGFARERVEQVTAKAHEVKESASKLKSEWNDRFSSAAGTGERVESLGHKSAEPRAGLVSELVASSKSAFEELQQNVEDKIKGPLGAVARYASVGRDMEEIRRRMAELEERLENLPQ